MPALPVHCLGLSHPSQSYLHMSPARNFTTNLPSRRLSASLDMPWILSQSWCYWGAVCCVFWRASNEPRSTCWTCNWLLCQSWNHRHCCGTYTSKHKIPSHSARRHHLGSCPPQLHRINIFIRNIRSYADDVKSNFLNLSSFDYHILEIVSCYPVQIMLGWIRVGKLVTFVYSSADQPLLKTKKINSCILLLW